MTDDTEVPYDLFVVNGLLLGGSYGLAHNTTLSLRWMSADEISGPPVAIDVGQVDVSVKF